MNTQRAMWSSLVAEQNSKTALNTAIWRAMGSMSTMAGRTINNDVPQVETVSIRQMAARAGDPEAAMVGVYLILEGGLRGHAVLILPQASALGLADLMLENPPGTSTSLGALERSALSEIGSVAVSHFLNVVAKHANASDLLLPSEPTVLEGKLSAILDAIVTPAAAVREDLLVIETAFTDTTGTVQGCLLVFPDPAMVDLVA